jgi:hypothetical protein
MCQKASGGPFMAFVRFPARQVQWLRPQAIFASSNRVERGFCGRCGTPLSYRQVDGSNISLTLNSLDDPELVRPELSFSANTQVSWCRALSDLPNREVDLIGTPGFSNFQRSTQVID